MNAIGCTLERLQVWYARVERQIDMEDAGAREDRQRQAIADRIYREIERIQDKEATEAAEREANTSDPELDAQLEAMMERIRAERG